MTLQPITKLNPATCAQAIAEINTRLDASNRTAVVFKGQAYSRDLDGSVWMLGAQEPFSNTWTDESFGFAPLTITADNIQAESYYNLVQLSRLICYANPIAALKATGQSVEVTRDDCGNIRSAKIVARS